MKIKEVAYQFSNSIVIRETAAYTNIDWSNLNFFSFFNSLVAKLRLLEMRMPRTSSFSVRDILDLPQMKTTSEGSATTGGVENDSISHATDLYAAASAQRLQGNFNILLDWM